MTWIWRTRAHYGLITLGLAGLLGALFVGEVGTPLPRLHPTTAEAALILPSLLAAALTGILARPYLPAETMSPRLVTRYVHGLTLALLLGLLAFYVLCYAIFDDDLLLAGGRNLLGFLGVGMAAVGIFRTLAPAVPILFALFCVVVNDRGGTGPLHWATESPLTAIHLGWAIAWFTLGTTALLTTTHRPARPNSTE